MFTVNFHATNGKELVIEACHRGSSTIENKSYSYVEVTLNADLTLFLSPENATQLAKALLSQVQQIEEEEIQENHA